MRDLWRPGRELRGITGRRNEWRRRYETFSKCKIEEEADYIRNCQRVGAGFDGRVLIDHNEPDQEVQYGYDTGLASVCYYCGRIEYGHF